MKRLVKNAHPFFWTLVVALALAVLAGALAAGRAPGYAPHPVGTVESMTDEKRALIEEKLAESRRLGEEAGRAADKAIAGLKRAARSGRYGDAGRVTPHYASVDAHAAAS